MNIRQYAQDSYEFLMEHLTEFIEKHELGHIFDPIIWCFETYPILSVLLSFLLVCYSIPVGIFLVFSGFSLLVAFTGFMVIEGTLLGIAFILLLSVLSILTAIFGSVLFVFWMAYAVTNQICERFFPDLMVQVNIPELSSATSKLHNHNHVHQRSNGSI